ncbi:terpene cyclase [Didymella keratinophila]|nr:terpene cyclase [Didymella keratinophila]
MRRDVENWLGSIIAPGKMLDGLLASDFALFGATLWPCASFDSLKIITYLVIWLFLWDDQFDDVQGSMYADSHAAQMYREQTIAFLRYALGIDVERPNVQNKIIVSFEAIGVAVRKHYTPEKCQMFLKELVYYIQMVEQEQRLRLSGTVASLEEFWHYRLGTSAATVILAVNELSWEGGNLPISFYVEKDVEQLYYYTNTIISALNDILSVKKEIKQEAIDSLIPIIFYETGDIQVATSRVVAFMKNEIRKMDDTAARLTLKYSNAEPALQEQVRLFIESCKYLATGTLVWSSCSKRYGVDKAEAGSGDIIMTL